ncbi:MAG: hypothetical protein RBR22_13120 [Desulfuromonas sp.]|nr:hypothetical protein [Desulfuromonas sp.]
MAKVLHHKVVAALPVPLEADSIYYVRAGDGFDIYITNGAGVVAAYEINQKTSPSPDAYTKSEMDSMLIGKAPSVHTHATSQVTGLDTALAGKAALRATSSVDGGVRMRLVGTTLYITNDGTDA